MISGLHVTLAIVASINEFVLALVVQLVQHAHRTELGSSQRRELVMPLPRHREKSVTTIHQVAMNDRIGILDRLKIERRVEESRVNGPYLNLNTHERPKLTAKLAALCALCNLMTKNTSLCFPIVAKIFVERSLPT